MRAMYDLQRFILITGLVASMGACGGPSTPAGGAQEPAGQEPAAMEHEGHAHEGAPKQGGEGEHHHQFTPEIGAFHDVLAPIWHMEAGPERQAKTCEAAESFVTMAREVESGAVPEAAQGGPDAWAAATAKQTAAFEALQAGCAAQSDDITELFSAAHDAFHGVIDLLGHKKG